MFQCPMCPRQLKSRSGLSGHLQFKHATKLQALEAAPVFTLLYQLLDPIECTVYMIDNDVSQLVSAVEMQEVILWETDTKVDLLRAEIKSQGEEHQKAMELVTRGLTKLSADLEELSRRIVQLNDKIETLTANRHPPGFCRDKSCKAGCNIRLKELEADTAKLLDYRFTAEKLKRLGF